MQKLRWQWKVCEGGVIAQRLDRFDYHKLANPWPKPRCHLSLSGTNRRWVLSASEKRNDSNTGPVCQSRPRPARPVFPEQTHGNIPQETGWRSHKLRFLTVKAIGCVSLCAQVPELPLDARAARAARVATASTVAVKLEVKSEARLARQVCVLDIPCCQCFRQRLGPPIPGCLDAICEI